AQISNRITLTLKAANLMFMCTVCATGYYSSVVSGNGSSTPRDCTPCGSGCANGTCDGQTGSCTCRLGWQPPFCDQVKVAAVADDGDSNTGAIVGAVVGAGVFLGICVIVGALLLRYRRFQTAWGKEVGGNTTSRVQETETAMEFSGGTSRPEREQGDGSDNYDKLANYENTDDIKLYTRRWVTVNTTSDHAYYYLNDLGVLVKDKTLVFYVTSSQDAIIRLAKTQGLSGSTCDVIIGSGSNTGLSVREDCSSCFSTLVASGVFLNETEAASFWLDWRSATTLQGGQGTVLGQSVLFTYTWTEKFEVNYMAVTNWYGHTGHWNVLIDTPPYFTVPNPDSSTALEIPENQPIGSTLITLEAQDDEGDSVTFAVVGQHGGTLECQGADVILREKLNYETERLLLVVIIASDGTHNTSVTFTLNIIDVIDEPPVLTLGPVTSLPEEMAAGTIVGGLFFVTDKDENDTLSFSLEGAHSHYFAINESTGTVTVANRIDRDGLVGLTRLDDVRVAVTDGAGLVTRLSLALDVDDVNDNPPVFGSDVYTVNITDTTTEDILLLTLDVTDADANSNGDVTITVSGDQGPEGLHMWTAGHDLHLNVSTLDLNDGPFSFTLTVQASDNPGTTPSLVAIAFVRVQVYPSNDHAPVWVSPVPDVSGSFPLLTIPEDSPVGTTILTLTATDADPGFFGHVSYSITSAASDSGADALHLFSINKMSGVLTTTGVLDRDPNTGGAAFYNVTLTASDPGAESSEAALCVFLDDVNDNAPSFSQPVYTRDVLCDVPVGTTLISLTSSDFDVTSKLVHEIDVGEKTLFSVNDVTGDVILMSSVTDRTSTVYVLTVTVKDGGVPEMTSTAAIVVRFQNCVTSTSTLSTVSSSLPSTLTSSSIAQDPSLSSLSDDDVTQTERVLQITCGVLGAGLLVSIIMHFIIKYSHKYEIHMKLNSILSKT
ncbi:hypothetical protein BaRGS_00022218, partial [Batillaria attramentaria]